jgi:hypothetical protein
MKTQVLYGVELKPRKMIKPSKTVNVSTPQGRADAEKAIKRVMEEHREVITALAFR